MERALEKHKAGRQAAGRAAEAGAGRRLQGREGAPRQECIHCHQVNEFRRADAKAAGTWTRDDLWVYPLPENVGITHRPGPRRHGQGRDRGSPAAKAGLKAGDRLVTLNGYSVASIADAQYALHKAPKSGDHPGRVGQRRRSQ